MVVAAVLCATCYGPYVQGETVVVVGGGGAAVKESDYLTRFAEKVVILHRRDSLRADRYNTHRALANPQGGDTLQHGREGHRGRRIRPRTGD